MNGYLGIDVGSVSTNLAVLDPVGTVLAKVYLRTCGRPIMAVQQGLSLIREELSANVGISGVGTTGSARHLAGIIAGADTV